MNDEESLITRAKNGESAAFGKLYDTYLPKIYRFVFLKTGRKQDAEDLTHQIFASAWENMSRYELKGFPFSSWLYRIANNAVIDYYRTWKHYQSIDAVPEEIFAETTNLETKLDAAFDIHIIKTALQKLEPDQQNILIMKFVDDLSNKEIAAVVGKSEGAVRVIQHRALKQLKQHVDARKPHPPIKEA